MAGFQYRNEDFDVNETGALFLAWPNSIFGHRRRCISAAEIGIAPGVTCVGPLLGTSGLKEQRGVAVASAHTTGFYRRAQSVAAGASHPSETAVELSYPACPLSG